MRGADGLSPKFAWALRPAVAGQSPGTTCARRRVSGDPPATLPRSACGRGAEHHTRDGYALRAETS